MIISRKYELIPKSKIVTRHSEVYRAFDVMDEQEKLVSVKKILGLKENDNIGNELFRREFTALKRLNHRNIIKLLETVVDDNQKYIVTEYFRSETLDVVIKNGLEIEGKIKIILQIIEAVIFAHSKGVIHRDLKPQNILVDDEGQVKIIDFGVSKIIDYNFKSTETVRQIVSFKYASPEQIKRKNISYQSDYYSLGLIMYFVLTGMEIEARDQAEVKKKLDSLSYSPEIKDIILQLTKDQAQDRPNNLYGILRKVEKEQLAIEVSEEHIHLKLSSQTKVQLNRYGAIDGDWSDEIAKKYIQEDLSKSFFYKNRAEYCVVGDSFVYFCKKDKKDGILKIINVRYIEDQISWETERDKGIVISSEWNIVLGEQKIVHEDDIDKYIAKLVNEDRAKEVKKKREQIKNELLAKWKSYLDEEFAILNDRSQALRYNSFQEGENGYKIYVDIVDKYMLENFERDDYIVMSYEGENIVVGQFDEIIDGKLSILIKNDIEIGKIEDKGNIQIDIKRARTNLIRFANALNAVKREESVNPNLANILTNPELVAMNKVANIEKYYQEVLDDNEENPQKRAIQKALATKDIFIIQGPPGTGKTTVISEIVCQILRNNPKDKVLLASQSHVAVDHAVNKITKLLPDKRAIRIGRSNSTKIAKESQNLLLANQLNEWIEEVKNNSQKAVERYVEEKAYSDRIKEIGLAWYKRLGKLEEFDEIFAENASIVAATCSGIATRHVLSDVSFEWVVIDEAARATPLELLIPMVKGQKIILVGDHKQLPPVVNTNISKEKLREKGLRKTDLEKSLFEDLIEDIKDDAKVVLTNQFRMHPDISNLVSEVFYPTDNITTTIVPEQRNHKLKWWPKSIVWMDTGKLVECNEDTEDNSKLNRSEAKVILETLKYIEEEYKSENKKISVGVISGYNAQKRLLKNLIKPDDTSRWGNIEIIIDNVDAFQGSETEIVLYSVVRSNSDEEIGFLKDSRRLNVALSRGKNLLIIIGNIKFLETAKAYWGNPMSTVIKFIKRHRDCCVIEVRDEHIRDNK